MEILFQFFTFFGSWLLFAGAIFQSALELREQDIERDRIHEIKKEISIPRNVSSWWWLLPPVKLILERVQTHKWRKEYFKILIPEDREALVNFTQKAKGWLFVAGGGILLALETTWRFTQLLDWDWWLRLITIVALIYISLFYTITQMKFAEKITSLE
jgi:hypothetical protein